MSIWLRTRHRMSEASRWTRLDTVAIVVVTVAGGILRLVRLTTTDMVLDEGYYAPDGCSYLNASPACVHDEFTPQHPPLGKWLIGFGIRIFGYSQGGWRIAALAAGTLTIALVYLLARRVLRSSLGAIVTSGLLAIDFLHFLHSRIAMLDVFVAFFGVAAFLFAIYDRDASATESSGWGRRLIGSRWRVAAGVAGGAAAATKWAGVPVILGVVALTLLSELSRRRADGRGRPILRTLRGESISIATVLILVPIVVYLLTYVGVVGGTFATWPWQPGSWLRAVLDRQTWMASFHSDISNFPPVPYTSPAWSWPLVKRPVLYAFEPGTGRFSEILAFGSPIVWWASLLALAGAAIGWIRARRMWCAEAVIVVSVLATWGPWIVLGTERAHMYLFYLLPAVPFLLLALGYAVVKISATRAGRAVVAVAAAVSLASFVFFYPLLTAMPLSPSGWHARIVFEEQCGTQRRVAADDSDLRALWRGRPPPGWCWI